MITETFQMDRDGSWKNNLLVVKNGPKYFRNKCAIKEKQSGQAQVETKPGAFTNTNDATISTPNTSTSTSTTGGVRTVNYDDAGGVTTAPMKKRKFENSTKDGLLLESIYTTVEKIKQASSLLNANVTLEVDGRVIGTTANV